MTSKPAAQHSLDVLFLTNFSDCCFRSIPAIAQMADVLQMRLTIMHVYDAEKTTRAQAENLVHSFYPEADRYASCRRVAVAGDLVSAVGRHIETWPVNLLIAPASDPNGLPRWGDRSLRAQLMEEFGLPVWTVGRQINWTRLFQPVRNVACWLDFRSANADHVAFAIDFANKMNAKLHLLRSMPEITEGSLVPLSYPDKALHPETVTQRILNLAASSSIRPRIHVDSGDSRRTMVRMLKQCDANVVFLPEQVRPFARWLPFGAHLGDGLPCPAICVARQGRVPTWNLQPGGGVKASTHAIPAPILAELGLA